MKTFNCTLNEKEYDIHVVEAMDQYGKENKTHFSEIPLVVFILEGQHFIYEIPEVLDLDNKVTLLNNTSILLEDREKINHKLFELFPGNYLNLFLSLRKSKKL